MNESVFEMTRRGGEYSSIMKVRRIRIVDIVNIRSQAQPHTRSPGGSTWLIPGRDENGSLGRGRKEIERRPKRGNEERVGKKAMK